MKTIVPKYYKEYGLYVNKNKMLPSITDGLLPVQRRILLTVHTVARNSYIRSSKVVGDCMARWHPHAEAYGTLQWAVQNGFVDGYGNWGAKIGIEDIGAAAMRYTKAKSNNFIEELSFKYVNYVNWVVSDDEMDPEPIAIPTMIPFCLMTKREISSIAFGFKTNIPCYNLNDLTARLMFLLKKEKEFIPVPFVNGCKILSSLKECDEIAKTGKGKLDIQGKYSIDKINQKISVNGWSSRTSFQTVLSKIDNYKGWNLLTNSDIGYIDESNQANGTKVVFEVVKLRNKPEIFKKMRKAIPASLSSSLTYNIIVVTPDGEIKEVGIDEMLLYSFSFYQASLKMFYIKSIESTKQNIKELKIIKKIQPHISSVLKLKIIDKIIRYLSDKTNVSVEDVKLIIDKYKIKKLLTFGIDIEELKKNIIEYENFLTNITKVTLSNYKKIKE